MQILPEAQFQRFIVDEREKAGTTRWPVAVVDVSFSLTIILPVRNHRDIPGCTHLTANKKRFSDDGERELCNYKITVEM